jgi:hypothetical protein
VVLDSEPPSPSVSVITISSSSDEEDLSTASSSSAAIRQPAQKAVKTATWPRKDRARPTRCAIVRPIDVKQELIAVEDENSNSSGGSLEAMARPCAPVNSLARTQSDSQAVMNQVDLQNARFLYGDQLMSLPGGASAPFYRQP